MTPFALGLVVAAAATAMAVQSPPVQRPEDKPSAQPPGAQLSAAQWPVLPVTVAANFEPHDRFGAGHRGVDLAATPGQLVRSALPGEVTFVGRVAGRTVVVVQHRGEVRTTYLPVVPTVRVGARVAAGSVLGRLDVDQHCPLSTCLHWGARRADDYVDPLGLLTRTGPIVLLPLTSPGSGGWGR